MTAVRVASVDEVTLTDPLRVDVDGVPVALVRDSAGEIHALGDTCTHGEISLSEGFIEGDTLECWAHGSRFNMFTGKPENLPAFEPVPVFPVTIEGDSVLIDVANPIDVSGDAAGKED